MTSGPNIKRSDRTRRPLEVTLDPEVRERLDGHCERTGETKSAVVERALRKELGLPPEQEEEG